MAALPFPAALVHEAFSRRERGWFPVSTCTATKHDGSSGYSHLAYTEALPEEKARTAIESRTTRLHTGVTNVMASYSQYRQA
ncbi:hypothetical protein SAMN04489732_11279 [Amycolatopsis saalfeldensis]|uniref:Uncharacterized protein n=1 Tax=Amycolatopsis saalfeldensis TaxID=394193 RepID=A0A1H8Y940_9PSEU|nr:hypothetical protein SAMN04489732_11279 [Amycolatopsis saalfeldensis]